MDSLVAVWMLHIKLNMSIFITAHTVQWIVHPVHQGHFVSRVNFSRDELLTSCWKKECLCIVGKFMIYMQRVNLVNITGMLLVLINVTWGIYAIPPSEACEGTLRSWLFSIIKIKQTPDNTGFLWLAFPKAFLVGDQDCSPAHRECPAEKGCLRLSLISTVNFGAVSENFYRPSVQSCMMAFLRRYMWTVLPAMCHFFPGLSQTSTVLPSTMVTSYTTSNSGQVPDLPMTMELGKKKGTFAFYGEIANRRLGFGFKLRRHAVTESNFVV